MVLPESTHRGLLSGRVAVEREDHPGWGHVALVTHDATQDLDVLDAERGATRGHCRLDAGQVASHHVRVALDHDRLTILGDQLLGDVKAIEHGGLLVDRGLAAVQVLGLDSVIVEQAPCPKTNHIAGDVTDGPHQATTEAVIEAATTTGQPCLLYTSPSPRD